MAALHKGIESTNELLEAHTHVWNHTFYFISSMCLKCAIELRIPDIIHKHGKPLTLSELIEALHINKEKSEGVYRLMRVLIHSKFFIKVKISEDNDDDEGYWLTAASRLLVKDEPVTMAPYTLSMLDPILVDPWHKVSEWFRDDSPSPFVTKHGATLWEFAETQPMLNQSFNDAMASDAHLATSVIIKECKQVFEGLKSMVDVGGGTGMVARAIADAFPGMKCSVLDLPHVVNGLEGTNNLTYVGGDMFESIPPSDAVFMKSTLHDWTDEECIKILKNCKESIPDKGGKVIIVEMVVGDQKEDHHKATENQLYFDVLMMILVTGKERTEKQWASLFFAAGFTSYKIHLVLASRSLIEVFP